MWKQNSLRLTAELDKLRNELLVETKHRASLQVDLLEIHTQFTGLQQELDKLRILMEGTREKQEAKENILFQMKDEDGITKEWEREMKFQKELNGNLALQLKRSQEANLELVSVLHEMENTMEKQQMEINNLSEDKVDIEDMDTYSISSEDNKRRSSEDQDFRKDVRKRGSCIEENVVQLREELEANGTKALKLQLHPLPEFRKEQEQNIPVSRKEKKIHGSKIGGMPNPRVGTPPEAQTKLENGDLYEDTLSTGTAEAERLGTEFSLALNAAFDSLRHENMLKDMEIEGLKHCKKELETQIISIEEEKSQMEANVTGLLGTNSMDPRVLANNIISKTSLKSKNENDELEAHLLELENENICLSERICGLEAVLRHLTDENESTRLLLQDSQSTVGKLQNKVSELENEIMAQKLDLTEKLEDRQKQCIEALEEGQNLKIENKKLQAMIESIMEENSLLQISNSELRKRKMDLQEHCAILEVEVKDTLELFSGILKEVESLEASFCRMLKEISLKEKSMTGELDALVREIQKHNANLARDDSLLNQMYLEKTAEVDNLERKVVHLMKQMSATFDEKEREASQAILELCCLREDKVMLEAALQEAQGKLRLCESKIDLIHRESERKVMGVIGELAVSKQNQDILMDCHRKVLSSQENVKNSELKLKNMLRRHELKLKASESDRQNLAEEVSALKIKLRKMEELQDEVLVLKKSLVEAEHQNKCLKASFEMLSEDYEKLKAKSVTYLEEISNIQMVASELGDYKRCKAALEEKVWRLEWELTAKEASCTLLSKMKNELARLTRTNSQLKGKIKYLEEEKEECFKRVQVLEEKLKQHKEEKHNEEAINGKLPHDPELYDTCGSTFDNTQSLKVSISTFHSY